MVNIFETNVKVYIKAAVLNNAVYFTKNFYEGALQEILHDYSAVFLKKDYTADLLLGIYQFVNAFGKFSSLDRQRK